MNSATKTVLGTLAVLALLGACGAGAVIGLGLYNVSARAGHLPGIPWVLHTTYRQSVRRQAPPESAVPDDLDDPDLIALGARHFDLACRTCHAAPGREQTATMAAMVPRPPHIRNAVEGWAPRHLHWIVHEGVKMSGMPGWPARRNDDVWAVVAFLSAVPGLDAPAYDDLIAGPDPAAVPDTPLATCAACHGADGRSGNARIPRLDIQSEAYLSASLDAYVTGRRDSGIMAQAAGEVPREALGSLAGHYAAGPTGGPLDIVPEPDLLAAGEALARAGTDEVPACTACHGPGATRASPYFPSLSGQHPEYLATQLRLWRDGKRGGGVRAGLMTKAARDLDDEQIAALAAWFATQTPGRRRPAP